MSAEDRLIQLREKRNKITEAKVRAETRVESARKQQREALAKLEKLGIKDPKTIPAKLEEFEGKAKKLLAEVDAGVPGRYKETDE